MLRLPLTPKARRDGHAQRNSPHHRQITRSIPVRADDMSGPAAFDVMFLSIKENGAAPARGRFATVLTALPS